MDQWIKWLSIGIIIYIVAVGNFNPKHLLDGDIIEKDASETAEKGSDVSINPKHFIDEKVEQVIDPLLEPEYKERVAGSNEESAAIKALSQQLIDKQLRNAGKTYGDMKQGRGVKAYCGQTVTIHYKSSTIDGMEIENTYTENKPVTFTTAGDGIFPGLSRGVAGMKEGGQRLFFFPSDQVYGAKGFAHDKAPENALVSIQAELLTLHENDFDISKLKTFTKKEGKGHVETECTDIVGINVTASTVDNTVIYNSRNKSVPLFFKIGEGKVPFGLEQAVLDMKKNGIITALVPPDLMRIQSTGTFSTTEPFAGFPKDEVILFDIELASITKTYLQSDTEEKP